MGFDGVFSVNKETNYFWDSKKKPLNHNPLEKRHTRLTEGKIKNLSGKEISNCLKEYEKINEIMGLLSTHSSLSFASNMVPEVPSTASFFISKEFIPFLLRSIRFNFIACLTVSHQKEGLILSEFCLKCLIFEVLNISPSAFKLAVFTPDVPISIPKEKVI